MKSNFGKIVKKARIDADVTLSEMAKDLRVTPSFLSSMENSKKNISHIWVEKIKEYFDGKNTPVENLDVYADISNDNIDISNLQFDHKMLVSQFANSDFTAEQLKAISQFMDDFNKK